MLGLDAVNRHCQRFVQPTNSSPPRSREVQKKKVKKKLYCCPLKRRLRLAWYSSWDLRLLRARLSASSNLRCTDRCRKAASSGPILLARMCSLVSRTQRSKSRSKWPWSHLNRQLNIEVKQYVVTCRSLLQHPKVSSSVQRSIQLGHECVPIPPAHVSHLET